MDVKKIGNQAPHNAFTGLTRFGDRWYCAFREGEGHVSLDGKLRIITSVDGDQWNSVALLSSPDAQLPDMRDAKIRVTPDNWLMVTGAAAWRGNGDAAHQTYMWLSQDGRRWDEPVAIGERDVWIWDFACDGETIYGAGHGANSNTEDWGVRLYRNNTAGSFDFVTTMRQDDQSPNETAMVFQGGRGVALMRREWAPEQSAGQSSERAIFEGNALLGTAVFPYTDWDWKDIGFHIGGPALIRLPDGRFIAGGRHMKPQVHTALWEVDIENATLRELITLPSSENITPPGSAWDNSYPGFVWHEDILYVSYYSSHEGKASIYLAKLEID